MWRNWLILSLLYLTINCRQLQDQFQVLSKAKDLRKYSSITQAISVSKPPLSELLIPRVSGSEGNSKVQHLIINHFEDLGWHVDLDTFNQTTPLGEIIFKNIIVTHGGQKARRKLVLAAHYDSKYFKDFEFIGATDSAASCAILMNLGTVLTDALDRRAEAGNGFTTVQMIFFDGEEAMIDWTDEDSIYGARHLASKWKDTLTVIQNDDGSTSEINPLSQIDALVLLDLLGKKDAVVPNSHIETQWLWDRLSRIHEKLGMLKLVSTHLQERIKKGDYMFPPGPPTVSALAIQDDHVPFYRLGVPITHLIPVPFPSEWHKEADNKDCLDEDTINDLALTFMVLVGEYLGLNEFL